MGEEQPRENMEGVENQEDMMIAENQETTCVGNPLFEQNENLVPENVDVHGNMIVNSAADTEMGCEAGVGLLPEVGLTSEVGANGDASNGPAAARAQPTVATGLGVNTVSFTTKSMAKTNPNSSDPVRARRQQKMGNSKGGVLPNPSRRGQVGAPSPDLIQKVANVFQQEFSSGRAPASHTVRKRGKIDAAKVSDEQGCVARPPLKQISQ